MGIDNFKIGGALLGSIAQRLLRQICRECKEPVEPNESLLQDAVQRSQACPLDAVFYRGRGCKKCLGTGYSGRIPIYEIMIVTPAMAEGIENGLPAHEAAADRARPKAWSNWPPPAWSRCSPAARRWKKCSTSCRASTSSSR